MAVVNSDIKDIRSDISILFDILEKIRENVDVAKFDAERALCKVSEVEAISGITSLWKRPAFQGGGGAAIMVTMFELIKGLLGG